MPERVGYVYELRACCWLAVPLETGVSEESVVKKGSEVEIGVTEMKEGQFYGILG